MFRVSLLGISGLALQSAAGADASSCSVQVRVVDPANADIPGAHVRFFEAGNTGSPREALTDATGAVNERLDAGRYRLEVQSPGFSTYTRDVDVACGNESSTQIDVQLQLGTMGSIVVVVQPPPANPFVRAWYRTRDLFWRLRHWS